MTNLIILHWRFNSHKRYMSAAPTFNIKTWPVQSVKSCVLTPEILNFLFNPGPWSRQEETETDSSLMGFTQNPTSLFHNLSPPPDWHSGRWFSVSFLPFSDTSFPSPLYSLRLKPKEALTLEAFWRLYRPLLDCQVLCNDVVSDVPNICRITLLWATICFFFIFHRELYSPQQHSPVT